MTISRFAGNFNAIAFAYGCAGSDAPPLQVISGSNTTGAYTLTCQPTASRTGAGLAIPISTTTPITVGSSTGIETVTPTAVSINALNQVLITATFGSAHGPGAQVSSGTVGLQEALNAASAYGGGTVTVDGAWFQAGGSQAIINAATVPAGVTILTNGGGGTLLATRVSIPLAAVRTLHSVPVQLLPNADATSMYYVTQAVFINRNTGTAYAGGGALTLGYGTTTSTTQALSGTVAATFMTSPVVDEVITLAGAQIADTTASTYLGKGLWLTAASADFTLGAGSLDVTIQYMKITK